MSCKSPASCVFALMFVALNPVNAQPAKPSLTGSWEFTVTPDTNAGRSATPIDGLATFTSDGTVIETDTTEVFGRVSPGHGIWQNGPIPGGYFFVRFTSLMPNLSGTRRAKRTVTMLLNLNPAGDGFDGTYDLEIVNLKGEVTFTEKGKVSGKLMTHPALP